MPKFTEMGQTIRVKGFDLTCRVEADEDMGPPWEEHDGHGVISKPKHHPFGYGSKPPKAPGERILYWERGQYRTYDVQATMEIAKRDGWGGEGKTDGERAANAVEADFKRMQEWCTDQWNWVGVVISVSKNDVELDRHAASLWGIESDAGDYLIEVANELISEAVEAGKSARASMRKALA